MTVTGDFLPLARSAIRVALVDDGEDFRQFLRDVLPAHWQVDVFPNADAFFKHVGSTQDWARDCALQQPSALQAQLAQWKVGHARFKRPNLVVMDHHMPGTSGLAAMGKLKAVPVAKVLLSGMATERAVIDSFNAGHLTAFVGKNEEDIGAAVIGHAERFLSAQAQDMEHPAARLSSEQLAVLHNPKVMSALKGLVGADAEYVIFGQPFGILVYGFEGDLRWIQLETTATLPASQELAIRCGVKPAMGPLLARGEVVSDAAFQQALDSGEKPNVTAVQARIALPDGQGELLIGTFFPDTPNLPGQAESYSAWNSAKVIPA